MGKRDDSFGRLDGHPADLLGDAIAVAIEADHAEHCDAFDAAAAAHALLADRERWDAYVALARRLGFRGDAEAVVFVAAATPAPRKGRDAADPVRAAIYAAAEADGHGPHSRKHGAAVVALPAHDPTEGIAYSVAGGMDYHATARKAPRPKAPGPAVGKQADARRLREIQQAKRVARETGQGFFFGLGFRAPRDPDDDLLPEGV